MAHGPWPVVLLPGSILPAQPAYEALLGKIGDEVDAHAKDLEMSAERLRSLALMEPAWAGPLCADGRAAWRRVPGFTLDVYGH